MQDNLENRSNLIELDLSPSQIDDALRELGSWRSPMGRERARTIAGSENFNNSEVDRVESNASLMENPIAFTVGSLTEMRQLPNFFTKETFVTGASQAQTQRLMSSCGVGKRAHSTESKEYLARIPSLTNVQSLTGSEYTGSLTNMSLRSLTGSERTEAEIGPRNSDYAYLNSQMEPKSFTSKLSDETINKRIHSTDSCEDLYKLESLPVQSGTSKESLSNVYEFIAATPSNSDYAYLDVNNQLKSTFIQ